MASRSMFKSGTAGKLVSLPELLLTHLSSTPSAHAMQKQLGLLQIRHVLSPAAHARVKGTHNSDVDPRPDPP